MKKKLKCIYYVIFWLLCFSVRLSNRNKMISTFFYQLEERGMMLPSTSYKVLRYHVSSKPIKTNMCGTRDSASNHRTNKFYRANFAILSTANLHYFTSLKLKLQDSAVWSILKEATCKISDLNINALKEE